MVEEHTAAGNQDIRELIEADWTHVVLIDDTGTEETRLDIPADARAEWVDPPSRDPRSLQIEVSGSDSDINYPVAIARTELYPDGTSTTPYSGDDLDEGPVDILTDTDTALITHDIS